MSFWPRERSHVRPGDHPERRTSFCQPASGYRRNGDDPSRHDAIAFQASQFWVGASVRGKLLLKVAELS